MLNEKIGASGYNDRGDVRRLNQALVDRDLPKFSRLVRNEFQNLTQEDWDEHQDLLRIFTTANGIEGWEGSGAAEVLSSATDDDFVSDTLVNQTQSASDATLDALEPGRSPDPDTDTSAGETAVAQEPALSDRQSLERLLTGRSVIRSGQRGDSVRALQRILITRLNQNGLESVATAMGEPDGAFGPKTKDAVEALQRKYDIDDDGVVGRQTASAILANDHVETQATRLRSSQRDDQSAGEEEAAQPSRPSDLGASFQWREELQAWFSERTHEYGGESYDLWIRKDGKDFHTNGSIGAVELSDFPEGMEESKSLSERLGMILSESLNLVAHDTDSEADTKIDGEVFQSNERPLQNMSDIPGLADLISTAANQAPDNYSYGGSGDSTQAYVTLEAPWVGEWDKYIYRDYVGNDDTNIWFYDDGSGNHKRINIDDEKIANQIEKEFKASNFTDPDTKNTDASASNSEDAVAQEMSDDLVALKDNLKDFFELIKLAPIDQQGYINKVKQTNKETRDFEEMGNLHRNLKVAFEESFATLLDQDFGKDNALFIGGNMDDDEKVEFTAQNKWADLRKNNLTKGQLSARLDIDGTRWHDSGLDTAWTKFVSGALAPRVQNFRIIDGTKAVNLVGHEQIIIARDALAIIKQFIIDANIPVTESLSYDRFQKLAGI